MELFFLALLILIMAGALASGYPVAFALPGAAIVSIVLAAICGYVFAGNTDAFFAQGGPSQWLSAGVTNLRGVYWEVERDTLIAIPLFIFMGIMLQRSKIAEDLLITMAQLFGPVRGGLGISVVFVGALLAATTGILGATVVAMGLISLPAMLRNGYSKSLATGTIAASGTLGQIIPPSIVLIILADQLASAVDQAGTSRTNSFKSATGELSMPSEFGVVSTSAGEMFLGAFVPGLVLVGLYMLYIFVLALVRPKVAPAVNRDGAFDGAFVAKVLVTLVPPLTLIFLVLGSIISGIATVNQAGAIGAAGALLMAGYRLKEGQPRAFWPAALGALSLAVIGFVLYNFDTNVKNISSDRDVLGVSIAVVAVVCLLVALVWSGWRAFRIENTLQGVMVDTAKTTSLVFIILLGAAMLTAAFRAFGGEEIVKEFLNGLPGGFWSQFIIVMAVIFILGFFLDFIEIAVVVVPIVAPILLADPSANITAVWLGVMIGLNIQTSFLTPPFGFALFYLRGVAPAIVRTLDMYKGVIAFIILQLCALGIVGYYPALVNYLPNRVSLTAETAPPPRNPKLQYCIEQYVGREFNQNGVAISAAIADASNLGTSFLPKKLSGELRDGLDNAIQVQTLLATAFEAEVMVREGAESYRPIHTDVRRLERMARSLQREIKHLESDMNDADNAAVNNRVAELRTESDALLAQIPNDWEQRQNAFQDLQKIERAARNKYRRAADDAYEPVAKLIAILDDNPKLDGLDAEISALRSKVVQGEPADMVDVVGTLAKRIGEVEGTGDIKSPISKALRALKAKIPNKDKALVLIDEALAELRAQQVWRGKATPLHEGLRRYEAAIKPTIGARQQERLSHEQALFVAGCSAGHRDISLNF
ncbi:MAG: C4-dicarboxylate ABC transporter permease [Thiotrichales bacterium]|nr:C4-dicarboxylate ABC transporter permease [Thiotrichales bacterium]